MTDCSRPILNGSGATDYARYMRTDELLTLQRDPDEVVHHDELMFQAVHQVTELWLKLANSERQRTLTAIGGSDLRYACVVAGWATAVVEFITDELIILQSLDPWVFQQIQVTLGHGSGFESLGWAAVRRTSQKLAQAVDALVKTRESIW